MSDFPYLSFSALSFERDDIPLFEGINVDLRAGNILQIEGPNGSGKTTLLRIFATSLSPAKGQIFWRQKEVVGGTRQHYLSDLLFIGHQPGVKQELTPRQNMNYWRSMSPSKESVSNESALQKIGLRGYEDVPCYSLSAGQLRRVALARLLITSATIWLLDEPFTAIDKQGVDEITRLLSDHAQQGGIIILSTHQDLGLEKVTRLSLEGALV